MSSPSLNTLSVNSEEQDSFLQPISIELLDGADSQGKDSGDGSSEEEEPIRNQLGTLSGVFTPVMLNIMGVILFLRLSWAVGQAGFLGVFSMFAIAEVQAIVTVLSLSTIISNGAMKAGGSYFMISRSMGPETGGSIGILFYSAYVAATTFYVIGFATTFQKTFLPDDGSSWTITLIGSVTLIVVVLVALGGAKYYTKVNVWLFVLQFTSIGIGIMAMLYRSAPIILEGGGKYLGFSFQRLRDNLGAHYTYDSSGCGGMCDFQLIFAIVFPATTGIMEGANLSGDLKTPSRSIPLGTFYGIGISFVIYVILMIAFAGSFDAETLHTNQIVMQDTTWEPLIVAFGAFVSTASSALGSIFGGSRVLQAIAADDLFPALGFFAKGSRVGNEPRRAVLLTFILCQGFLFVGSLDLVAPIISSFFCLSYTAVNFSAFLLDAVRTPNWRPQFQYFHRYIGLFGAILNLGVMMYLNMLYALISLLALALIFIWLSYKAPFKEWGDVRQAVISHQLRKFLLKLDYTGHGKLWRPSILVLSDDVAPHCPLLEFANDVKKGGFFMIGVGLTGDLRETAERHGMVREYMRRFINAQNFKAFPQVSVARNGREACQSLVLVSGLGAVAPNMVAVPLLQRLVDKTIGISPAEERKGSDQESSLDLKLDADNQITSLLNCLDLRSSREWVEVLTDILLMKKNLLVTANFEDDSPQADLTDLEMFTRSPSSSNRTSLLSSSPHADLCVDVWMTGAEDTLEANSFTGTAPFMIQLGHILMSRNQPLGRGPTRTLRLIRLVPRDSTPRRERVLVEKLLDTLRVPVDDLVFVVPPDDGPLQPRDFNEMIRKECLTTSNLILAGLPAMPQAPLDMAECDEFMRNVYAITRDLPPTVLVDAGANETRMFSSEI